MNRVTSAREWLLVCVFGARVCISCVRLEMKPEYLFTYAQG